MAGPSIGTWVKVKTKTGLTPRVIPNKDGGGQYSQGQVITQSEFNELRQKRAERLQQGGRVSELPAKKSRQERRLEQATAKAEKLQKQMDSLVASDNIPGAFQAGRSNYSLGKKREAMNTRLSNTYRELEQAKKQAAELGQSVNFRRGKEQARPIWKEHGKAMVEHYSKTTGKTKKEVRESLDGMAKWEPQKFLKIANKYLELTGAS